MNVKIKLAGLRKEFELTKVKSQKIKVIGKSKTSSSSISDDSVNKSISFSFINDDHAVKESMTVKERIKIPNLSVYDLDENDGELIVKYMISSFFRKYEQASYANIKRETKFINALINFIIQTFVSKKFKSNFKEIDDKEFRNFVSR